MRAPASTWSSPTDRRTCCAPSSKARKPAAVRPRWGVVLVALAIGFGLIEAAGWDELTPGVFAILLAATGIGNLGAYFLGNRVK
jgi:hypothetical protein